MIQVGNKQVFDAFVGGKQVLEIWRGSNLVWKKEAPPVESQIVNINFSETGFTDDDAAGWNTLRFPNAGGVIQDITTISFPGLLDEDGVNTGISFKVDSLSNPSNPPGISRVDIPQSFPISQIYIRDFWDYGSPGTSMVWKISGLDVNAKYDLRAIPYIDGGNASMLSVDGGATWTSVASAYPTMWDFDDPNYISINDIVPNAGGEILINTSSGSGSLWFSILALRLRKQGSTPKETTAKLTIDISEAPKDVFILYNDEVQPVSMLLFPLNTDVQNITPTADGYTFSPASQSVMMDSDKTITFTATPV